MKTKNEQLILTIETTRNLQGRTQRKYRAAQWFARMRRVVDSATDWRPAKGRPEQQLLIPARQAMSSVDR